MKAENCNQAMSKPAQTVEANTKAIEENGKAVAEMVNLLRAKVIQWDGLQYFTTSTKEINEITTVISVIENWWFKFYYTS